MQILKIPRVFGGFFLESSYDRSSVVPLVVVIKQT